MKNEKNDRNPFVTGFKAEDFSPDRAYGITVEGRSGWPAGASFFKNETVKIIFGKLAGKSGTVIGCYKSGTQWIYTLEIDGTAETATELELARPH